MSDKTVLNIPNVPKDLLEKAQAIAKQQDRPLAQVVRELLRNWVAQHEQKSKQPAK